MYKQAVPVEVVCETMAGTCSRSHFNCFLLHFDLVF